MKLKQEYEAYKAHKEELLAKNEGQFVLIRENEIIEVFASYDDALKAGLNKFGNVPFLVKQIQRDEEVNFFFNHIAA